MAWDPTIPADDELLINFPALCRANWQALEDLTDTALQITDAKIAASANISDTKLAQITTPGKVSGAALTSLGSIPNGAGVIPVANLPNKLSANSSDSSPEYLDGLINTSFFQIVNDKLEIKHGSGSGLDADKVDGYDASTTPQANTIPVANGDGSIKDWITDQEVLDKLKNVDGEGSGLDADLLRGLPADFTCSKNQNGYTKLPNGLILQWGQILNRADADTTPINFPIAFPNACFAVVVSDGEANDGQQNWNSLTYNITTTSFVFVNHNGVTTNFRWLAIGY